MEQARTAGKRPYYCGGAPQQVKRVGQVYQSAALVHRPVSRRELQLGLLLAVASSLGVTALLLIILLT